MSAQLLIILLSEALPLGWYWRRPVFSIFRTAYGNWNKTATANSHLLCCQKNGVVSALAKDVSNSNSEVTRTISLMLTCTWQTMVWSHWNKKSFLVLTMKSNGRWYNLNLILIELATLQDVGDNTPPWRYEYIGWRMIAAPAWQNPPNNKLMSLSAVGQRGPRWAVWASIVSLVLLLKLKLPKGTTMMCLDRYSERPQTFCFYYRL